MENPLTHAFVFGGLEPFDSFEDLKALLECIRNKYNCQDDIVIYTGYTEDELVHGARTELHDYYFYISNHFSNIIIKFGRFVPNQEKHYDVTLGVELASPNQYAKRI